MNPYRVFDIGDDGTRWFVQDLSGRDVNEDKARMAVIWYLYDCLQRDNGSETALFGMLVQALLDAPTEWFDYWYLDEKTGVLRKDGRTPLEINAPDNHLKDYYMTGWFFGIR